MASCESHLKEEPSLDTEHQMAQIRNVWFNDGSKRIDFILLYNLDKSDEEQANARLIFERNLQHEGLLLEYDVREEGLTCVKVHATWEVLTRYAEIMKIRMPMKLVGSEKHMARINLWEVVSDCFTVVTRPFQYNKQEVPDIKKQFTSPFSRDKEYLFDIADNKENFFPTQVRIQIVDYILRRKRFTDNAEDKIDFGINKMISDEAYVAAFPLHDGLWKSSAAANERQLLYAHWAYWRNAGKMQPLDHIRNYFGEKIALYFTWLGFYTFMLVPAAVVGLIVFLYGCFTIPDNIFIKEVCDEKNNFTMCPQCDKRCPYWRLNKSCYHVMASHIVDNGATVFYALFMAVWATLFLEFWKRQQVTMQYRWNLINFEEEEEPPRPEYLGRLAAAKTTKINRITGITEPYVPVVKRVVIYLTSFSTMIFLVLIAVAAVIGVIAFRAATLAALYLQDREIIYKNASMVTSACAACINLVIIMLLNIVYQRVAVFLTEFEPQRSQSDYDDSLTLKLYALQFVNYYASIFYIAFFKGKFVGRPGSYKTIFGARQEECQAGGCLIELFIQLAIIMVGKQLIQNNLVEIILPIVKKKLTRWFKKEREEVKEKQTPWEEDYNLLPTPPRVLFYEYLEMCLQYGFLTIFVSAFPLAPLFALINNVMEIRLDAGKFAKKQRRPVADRAQDIGIWHGILYAVTYLAVMSNALIIAFTSEFLPRLVYTTAYSPDGTLTGYVNNSLSYFATSDFSSESHPESDNQTLLCRYKSYRRAPWENNKYGFTEQYWHVMAAKLAFVVMFENVVFITRSVIKWLVPDVPRRLREKIRQEAYATNEILLNTELQRARGKDVDDIIDTMASDKKNGTAAIDGNLATTDGVRLRVNTDNRDSGDFERSGSYRHAVEANEIPYADTDQLYHDTSV